MNRAVQSRELEIYLDFQLKRLINEYIYWLETVKISNFLNSSQHEILGCAPIMFLIILQYCLHPFQLAVYFQNYLYCRHHIIF